MDFYKINPNDLFPLPPSLDGRILFYYLISPSKDRGNGNKSFEFMIGVSVSVRRDKSRLY